MQNEAKLIEKDNVILLNSYRKGTDDNGSITDENWLRNLSEGTVFLARKNTRPGQEKELVLNSYVVRKHLELSSNLMWVTPDGNQLDIWVPSLEFSRNFTFWETVMVLGLKEQQEDNSNEKTRDGLEGVEGQATSG